MAGGGLKMVAGKQKVGPYPGDRTIGIKLYSKKVDLVVVSLRLRAGHSTGVKTSMERNINLRFHIDGLYVAML